jgi:Mg/Co/Ni transporter MgtE
MIDQINQIVAKAFWIGFCAGGVLGMVFVLIAILAGRMF